MLLFLKFKIIYQIKNFARNIFISVNISINLNFYQNNGDKGINGLNITGAKSRKECTELDSLSLTCQSWDLEKELLGEKYRAKPTAKRHIDND